jgi:hypothetical protein
MNIKYGGDMLKFINGELICDCENKLFRTIPNEEDENSLSKLVCSECSKVVDKTILLYTLGNFVETKEEIKDMKYAVNDLLKSFSKTSKIKSTMNEIKETIEELDKLWILPEGHLIGDICKVYDIITSNLPSRIGFEEAILVPGVDKTTYVFNLYRNEIRSKNDIATITIEKNNNSENLIINVNIHLVETRRFVIEKWLRVYEVLSYLDIKLNYS